MSRTTVGWPTGKMAASAGRDTPGRRPTRMAPAATAAPVDPAETMPAASPSATRRAAVLIDECRLSRMAEATSSPMPISSGACTMGRSAPHSRRRGRNRLSSPTRTTSTPRLAASTAPPTVSCGAWSPPIASRAMRVMASSGGAHHLPPVVRAALRAGAMGRFGGPALRAGRGGRAGHLPRRLPLPGAGAGHLLLRDRHDDSPRFTRSRLQQVTQGRERRTRRLVMPWAGTRIQVGAADGAKSEAVGTAERAQRQGQEHGVAQRRFQVGFVPGSRYSASGSAARISSIVHFRRLRPLGQAAAAGVADSRLHPAADDDAARSPLEDQVGPQRLRRIHSGQFQGPVHPGLHLDRATMPRAGEGGRRPRGAKEGGARPDCIGRPAAYPTSPIPGIPGRAWCRSARARAHLGQQVGQHRLRRCSKACSP